MQFSCQELENLADETLRLYSDGSIPVSVTSVAKNLGLSILNGTNQSNILGFIILDEKTIYVGENMPNHRKRLNIAHQIGKYFIAKKTADNKDDSGDEVISEEALNNQANIFARNLLMPRNKFEECRKSGLSNFDMADKFWVSLEMINQRIEYLGASN